MAFTLCSSEAIVAKAGANANTDATGSLALLTQYSTEAEAEVMNVSRYDWVTNYGSLTTNVKEILAETCSNLGGMNLISYDMSGFTSRYEAETMLDVLRDGVMRGLSMLRVEDNRKFIGKP